MAIRRVLTIGDLDRGQRSRSIARLDEEAFLLAHDLRDTMHASPACVGLAAPQIGINLRAFIVDVSEHKKATTCHGEFIMFNPELVVAEAPQIAREGCMSVPDLTGDVSRATRVVVRGFDFEGKSIEITTDDYEARAILHEIDHLDGLVFLDRLAGPNALHARRVYR